MLKIDDRLEVESPRDCTCHPDDNPPVPCPRKHAFSECVAAAAKLSTTEISINDVRGGEMEIYALTDQHIKALELAIRAKGYSVLADPETSEITLVKNGTARNAAPAGA